MSDPPPLSPSGSGAVIVTDRGAATQVELMLGCPLAPADAAGTIANQVLANVINGRVGRIRTEMGASYGLRASSSTFGGGTAVLHVQGAVDNAGLPAALRAIRSAVAGTNEMTSAEFDRGRWAVARAYNLELATADDWVERALALGRQGWDLATADEVPRVLASIDRARLNASLRRCATEAVLSAVGNESTIRRAIADGWK